MEYSRKKYKKYGSLYMVFNITKEDVIRVFNKYIKGKPAVILIVVPDEGTPPAQPDNYKIPNSGDNPFPSTDYSGLTYNRPTGDKFDRSKPPVPGASPLVKVPDFEAAIEEAQKTSYGLAAGLLSDNADHYKVFSRRVRAGHMVWNRQTTGASGRLPFGGLGKSGNHRPSGYFAVDYCTDPVASLEMETLTLPSNPLPGIE